MNKLFKKIIKYGGIFTVLSAIIFAFFFWRSLNSQDPPKVLNVALTPETKHIGDVISVEMTIELPWYRKLIGKAQVKMPEGLQVVGNDVNQFGRLRLGTWEWKKIIQFQAYDFGPFSELESVIILTPDRLDGNDSITVKIPEISIQSMLDDGNDELRIAEELSDDFLKSNTQKSNHYSLIAIVLAVIILLSFFLLKKRTHKIVVPPKPWIVAESMLMQLQERFPLDAETVFVELTDIVRKYIEAAFELPAAEMTTPEFLNQINQDSKSLNTDQKLLLTDFLTAADMVKFARVDVNQGQIDETLKKAKRFVVETSEEIIKQSLVGKSPDRAHEKSI